MTRNLKSRIIHRYFKMVFKVKQFILMEIQVYINQINKSHADKKVKINTLSIFTKKSRNLIIIINLKEAKLILDIIKKTNNVKVK